MELALVWGVEVVHMVHSGNRISDITHLAGL